MAAVDLPAAQSDYAYAEQELQNHILEVYGTNNNSDDMFRPALADSQKIGFFSLDRNSQTEISEIVDLKEMTEVLQILLQDVATLRRDINFTKHVMQADHESKLQQKSLELYCRINERVIELEKIHEDRVSALRKAFKQQLADAIARLSTMYKKNLESNIHRERTRQEWDLKNQDSRMQELKSTVAHQESIIQMLKLQLQQQQQAQQTDRQFFLDDTSSTKSKSTCASDSPVMVAMMAERKRLEEEKMKQFTPRAKPVTFKSEVTSVGSDTPVTSSRIQQLEGEVEDLQKETEKLDRKNKRLEDALEIKEEQTSQLQLQVEDLQRRLEKEKILSDQLKHEKEEIRVEAEKEVQQSKKQVDEMLMKQKLEMEQSTSEQLRQAREEAVRAAQSEAARLQAQDQDKLREIMEQKKALEKQLATERSKSSVKSQKGDAERDSMKQSESQLKEQVQRLKEELERVHMTWEKKFAILQASMHVLKDESYIRRQLQRQAAMLHHASVSYAADAPGVGVNGPDKQGGQQKKPLPDIQRRSRQEGSKDYISYTVSAPSGRGTAAMSVDENQVISDNDQDLPDDIMPIPEPPARTLQDCGAADDSSRPSTHSHIVVLPTTSA